jgi:hypothetical protein
MAPWSETTSVRAVIAGILVCAYAFASFGVWPSPRWLAQRVAAIQGERFPCEACGCGCASAHECWTACCCHTPVERLAWAIREGVQPPEGLSFSDAEWMQAANLADPGSAPCLLCVGQTRDRLAHAAARADRAAGIELDQCGSDASCNDSCSGAGDGGTKCASARTGGVPGRSISALSCKGVRQLLTLGLSTATLLGSQPDHPAIGVMTVVGLDQRSMDSRALDVPAPPPRQARAGFRVRVQALSIDHG